MNTSNKTILISLLLLSASLTFQSSAMEMEKDSNQEDINSLSLSPSASPKSSEMSLNAVAEGDLFLFRGHKPIYAEGLDEEDGLTEAEKHQLKIKANDMMVKIWAISKESSDWRNHGHPFFKKDQFANYLPYKLFKGKEEGNIITVEMYDKTIVFHLNQLDYRYADLGRFENALQRLKDRFVARPDYFCNAEASLLNKGIIIKNGDDEISHGPNGFKDE